MKIAIICRSAYGDLICTMPLIRHLQRKYQPELLTLFVDEKNFSILEFFPSDIHVDVRVMKAKGNKYLNIWGTAMKYRKRGYDLVVCAKPQPMKAYNIFTFLLGARRRCASVAGGWHAKLVNEPKLFDPQSESSRHHALKVLNIYDSDIDQIPEDIMPRLEIPDKIRLTHKAHLGSRLAEINDAIGPVVLVSVSNQRDHSFLGVEKYAQVLNTVAASYDMKVVISAMPKDRDRARDLSARLSVKNVIVNTPKLQALMILIDSVDLLFHGDGGIMHMAAALDKPQLVLFGDTQLAVWRPLSEKAVTLRDDQDVKNIDLPAIIEALSRLLTDVSAPSRAVAES